MKKLSIQILTLLLLAVAFAFFYSNGTDRAYTEGSQLGYEASMMTLNEALDSLGKQKDEDIMGDYSVILVETQSLVDTQRFIINSSYLDSLLAQQIQDSLAIR